MNKSPDDKEVEDLSVLDREISLEGERPASFPEDDIEGLGRDSIIRKLSHRVTILSILVPAVFCAIFLFAYLDTRHRLKQIESTGLTEVQELSGDLEHRITSLSDEQSALEKSMADRVSSLEKSAASNKEDLDRHEKSIKRHAQSKASKKALEKHSEGVTNTVFMLQQDVSKHREAVDAVIKALRRQLDAATSAVSLLRDDLPVQKREMAVLLKAIENMRDIDEAQETAIKHLTERMVGKEELEDFLKTERTNYEQTRTALEKQIKRLRDEISALQKRPGQIGKTNAVPQAKNERLKVKPSGKTKKAEPGPEPAPGQILEQEITE